MCHITQEDIDNAVTDAMSNTKTRLSDLLDSIQRKTSICDNPQIVNALEEVAGEIIAIEQDL